MSTQLKSITPKCIDNNIRHLLSKSEFLDSLLKNIEIGKQKFSDIKIEKVNTISNDLLEFINKYYRYTEKEKLELYYDFKDQKTYFFIAFKENKIIASLGCMIKNIYICGISEPRGLASTLCISPELRNNGLVNYMNSIAMYTACYDYDIMTFYHTGINPLKSSFTNTIYYEYPIQLKSLAEKGLHFNRPRPIPAYELPIQQKIPTVTWIENQKNFYKRNGYMAYFDWTIKEAEQWLSRPDLIQLTWENDSESNVCMIAKDDKNVNTMCIYTYCFSDIKKTEEMLASVIKWLRQNTDCELIRIINSPVPLLCWTQYTNFFHFVVNQSTQPIPSELNALFFIH
jgi:hypothetical protein